MTWKLRYAPHLGITSAEQPMFLNSVGSADPVAHIRFAAEQGFAGIEDNHGVGRPPEVLDRMGSELARLGMEMGCVVSTRKSMSEPMWGLPGAEVRAALVKELEVAIVAAKRLGARRLTVAGMRDARLPFGVQKANLIGHLRHLADIAERAGVVMVLEQICAQRMPGMLIQHFEDLYEVICAVNAPSVRLLFDSVHCQYADGNLAGNLEMCWDQMAVVQIADVPGRLEPGTGEINFPYLLRMIRDRGYKGLVEIEAFLSSPGIEGERAMLERLRAIDAAI